MNLADLIDEPLRKTADEDRKAFYDKLFDACRQPHLEGNKKYILEYAKEAFKYPSLQEFNKTCECIQQLISACKSDDFCLTLLQLFPWQEKLPFILSDVACPALYYAVVKKFNHVTAYLVDQCHISPHEVDICGGTAMHAAATGGDLELMDYLYEKGGNPLIVDDMGRRPSQLVPSFCENILNKAKELEAKAEQDEAKKAEALKFAEKRKLIIAEKERKASGFNAMRQARAAQQEATEEQEHKARVLREKQLEKTTGSSAHKTNSSFIGGIFEGFRRRKGYTPVENSENAGISKQSSSPTRSDARLY